MEENAEQPSLTYPDLKLELIDQFKHNRRDHEILRAIMERRQQPHETFDDFYGDIRTLTLQMRSRPHEDDLVAILRQNLKDKIATLIFGCTIRSLHELRDECRRADKYIAARGIRFRRNVSEVNGDRESYMTRRDMLAEPEDDEDEIAATQHKRTNRQINFSNFEKPYGPNPDNKLTVKADQTSTVTSTSTACPSTFHTLTCFSCGQGNLAYHCPKCQGNAKVVGATGSSSAMTNSLPGPDKSQF